MPTSAPRPCTVPGCPQFAHGRYGRCAAHEAEADRRKGTTTERGYDGRWRRAAARKLRGTPGCEWPGCTARAVTVDHIDGDATGPRRLDPANHRSYCGYHHRLRTARDQPGGVRLR